MPPPSHDGSSSATHAFPKTGDGLYLALLTALLWLPLPLGSFQPLYSGIMSCLTSALLCLWGIGLLHRRYAVPASFIKAWPLLALWGVWIAYLLIQLLPLPLSWVETLSPIALDWHLRGTPQATVATLSVDRQATWEGLLKSLSYLSLFTLTLLLVRRSRHLRWFGYAIVFSGLFQALYGSFLVLSLRGGDASGTFFTRNLYAGYLVMCLSVGIGLLLGQMEQQAFNGWRQRLRHALAWILGEKMRLRIYLAVMVVALVLTHSRMGNTSFFVALTLAGMISLMLSWHAPRSMIILLASLLVIDLLILGAWFGLDKVAERLNQTALGENVRVNLNEFTFRYWADYPLTGSGLGSFKQHFQSYHGAEIKQEFHYAHNDYLQLGSEVGVIGLVLLGLPVALNLVVVLLGMYRRKRPLTQGVAFGTLMSAIALALHSTVDYNLQIPSNAATFMAILAAGLAATFLPSRRETVNPVDPIDWQPRSAIARGGTILFTVGAGLLFLTSCLWCHSSWRFEEIIHITRSQDDGRRTSTAELLAAESKLQQMIAITPGNPSLSEELGLLYTQLAERQPPASAKTTAYYREALAAFRRTSRQRPANATAWANIVWLKAYLKEYDQTLFDAMENAVAAGPWRPYVVSSVAETGLILWPVLPQASRATVIGAFNKALLLVPEQAEAWSDNTALRQELCGYPGEYKALRAYCTRSR